MNQRVTPPGPAKGRRAWLYLSLLLPALASEVAQCPPPTDCEEAPLLPLDYNGSPRGYMHYIGPPQLRFQEVVPPPDLSVRPPAGAPPTLRSMNSGGGISATVSFKPAPPTANAATASAKMDEVRPNSTLAPQNTPPPPQPPPSIMPDDVAPKVRPEDFLPYFQFPGTEAPSNDVNASSQAGPAPKAIPGSSATYQEQLQ